MPPPPMPSPSPVPIAPPARPAFNDSDWDAVDLPHDFLRGGQYSEHNSEDNAFLPRNTSWYRKNFFLPTSMQGKSIWVRFGGIFHATRAYFNGQALQVHSEGYTQWQVRLDNATTVHYGDSGSDSESNVLALFVDATESSSWWYMGGGPFAQDVELVVHEPSTHVAFDGVYGIANVSLSDVSDDGLTSSGAEVQAVVELQSDSTAGATVSLTASLLDEAGMQIATAGPMVVKIPGNTSPPFPRMKLVFSRLSNASLWSIQQPYLYTMAITVSDQSTSAVLD